MQQRRGATGAGRCCCRSAAVLLLLYIGNLMIKIN